MKKVGGLRPDSLIPSPARFIGPSPGNPSRGKGQPGKIVCTQTLDPSPLPVLVGAENGNQGNALLFNGSLGERGGTETEEQGAAQDTRQRETGGVGAG